MLTLNRKHQEDLQRRGLKPEQIEAQRYRSVPLFGMKKLVKRLAEEGYMVKGVPGFYRDTDGNWTINFKAENSGILIPIVSLDGFIPVSYTHLIWTRLQKTAWIRYRS